jgi:hypothetical protein
MHVSALKKLLLDSDLTVQEWLVKLKEDTESTNHYMATKVHNIQRCLAKVFATPLVRWRMPLAEFPSHYPNVAIQLDLH